MATRLGVVVLILALSGCTLFGRQTTIANLTNQPLENVRLSFVSQKIEQPVGQIAPGQVVPFTIPASIGETNLIVYYSLGERTFSKNCGYVEGRGYTVQIKILSVSDVQCEVKLSSV